MPVLIKKYKNIIKFSQNNKTFKFYSEKFRPNVCEMNWDSGRGRQPVATASLMYTDGNEQREARYWFTLAQNDAV